MAAVAKTLANLSDPSAAGFADPRYGPEQCTLHLNCLSCEYFRRCLSCDMLGQLEALTVCYCSSSMGSTLDLLQQNIQHLARYTRCTLSFGKAVKCAIHFSYGCSLSAEERQQLVKDHQAAGRPQTQQAYKQHIKKFQVLPQAEVQSLVFIA